MMNRRAIVRLLGVFAAAAGGKRVEGNDQFSGAVLKVNPSDAPIGMILNLEDEGVPRGPYTSALNFIEVRYQNKTVRLSAKEIMEALES